MSHSNSKYRIVRYGWWARVNHWIIAISFVLLTLSGLALFYPVFFGLTSLFGGPEPTRIVHPYIGVFMSAFFVIQAIRFFGDNLFRRHDMQWMKQIGDVLSNRDEKLPPVGKNNAGQKLVYWVFLATVPVLLVTGIVLWRPWIAADMPVWALRLAVTVHAYAAFLAIITLVIHVYSAIWVKGSVRAMTQGTVSDAWARHHHDLWYRDIIRKRKSGDQPVSPTSEAQDRHR